MVGFCRIYVAEFDGGIADIERARELAIKLGDRHGEMFALEARGELLAFCDRYSDAEPILEQALALAVSIGARRYQAILLLAMAECSLASGRVADAREQIDRALVASRETDMRFCGPMVLGIKARLHDDEHDRARCRAEAEALLAEGLIGHNVIGYHRQGMEDALERGEWSRGLRHASALEAYTRPEPLPYADFLIARYRALTGLASRPGERALHDELARLRGEAERLRWPISWPEWALRAASQRPA
jgi:tetratricopeptide (TPR) repeat protein